MKNHIALQAQSSQQAQSRNLKVYAKIGYGSAGTTVNNCTNRGTVTGQYNNSRAAYGGIVGYAFANASVTNTVSNCTNYGDVKSTALTISNITANTTVTVTFREKTQAADYFQEFFKAKTNMTAEKVSGWTSANGKTIKASGTAASVFKLTVKEDGYLAVYGTVDGTLAKVNAVNQKNETVGVLATVSMTATQTAFEKAVKKDDVITFTYTNLAVNGTDNYVEITGITLTAECPHTVHPFTEKTDATCTTDGNVAYYKCLTCNKYFSDPTCKNELTEVILPAHHTYAAARAEDRCDHGRPEGRADHGPRRHQRYERHGRQQQDVRCAR